jgi:hypothetical protein
MTHTFSQRAIQVHCEVRDGVDDTKSVQLAESELALK